MRALLIKVHSIVFALWLAWLLCWTVYGYVRDHQAHCAAWFYEFDRPADWGQSNARRTTCVEEAR